MSSSGVGPEQDPFGRHYRSEEIERIRRKEEEALGKAPSGCFPSQERSGFAAFLFLLIEKLLEFVTRWAGSGIAAASEAEVKETLLRLRDALKVLMQEDRSQDAHFLRKLAQTWQTLLEQALNVRESSPMMQKLKAFIKEIERYPEGEEHTLGYYLEKYAGLKWLPFPYMELIQKLHRLNELNPDSSPLSDWFGKIEEMLTLST